MAHLAVDIGSAFVDIALQSPDSCRIRKVAIGTRSGIEAALDGIGASLAAWSVPIESLESIRIASTEAINMLLARRGARIALVTTQGFGDCLWLGRQNRADLYDPVARSPAPTFLVDRNHTYEIAGRMDVAGREVTPLDERAIRVAAREMGERGIEAVAVCFLFGHVNPRHEQRCREMIGEVLPDVDVCLSHEVDPQPREYERTVSVCLEASLRPMLTRTTALLQEDLRRRGFLGKLLFSDSRAGLHNAEAVKTRVSRLVASGPAASARCAAATAKSRKAPWAIALDIGSASTDLCLIENGEPRACHHTIYAGIPLRQSMFDVVSIDLGGSSRVFRDGSGRVSLVAARRHREQGPTLSDALFVADRIPGDGAIDKEKAWSAFGRSEKEALSAAREIIEAAERKIAAGILDYAVKRNVDLPRRH